MSAPLLSTPTKAAAPSPSTDSPGTWRHPRLNEITRRRDATTFSEKNVRRIAYNVVTLLVLWASRLLAKRHINPNIITPTNLLYLTWAWTIFQIIPIIQIGFACLPLLRAKDDLSDIALTPAQRQLLGLPLLSSAPGPDAKFSTPPRYSRTPSIAGSVGSRGSYTNSPLSGRGSPVVAGPGGGGSPYSPLESPLLTKGGSVLGNGRRSSNGSGSPFDRLNGGGGGGGAVSSGIGLFGEASPTPGPVSPAGGKRTSVGLNSKWLYEKGRRSSGSAWVH